MINSEVIYKRIILKISGEALQGTKNFGIDVNVLNYIVKEIEELIKLGIQIGIVIGGGNLFRGSELEKYGVSRMTSDNIGMISTIINSLAIYDAFNQSYINARLVSSIPINGICNNYDCIEIINFLIKNKVVIFAAGTANSLFTTDSAACLRGIEIKAELILKATKVDGVFSNNPMKYANVVFYDKLNYQFLLQEELKIMDLTALTLAKDNNMKICVFNFNKPGALKRIIMGEKEGTFISS